MSSTEDSVLSDLRSELPRRKKCDRTRPVCERCTKGRFKCLGYDNDPLESPLTEKVFGSTRTLGRLDINDPAPTPRCVETPSATRAVQNQSSSRLTGPNALSRNLDDVPSEDAKSRLESFNDSENSILSAGALELMAKSLSKPQGLSTLAQELRAFDGVWPQEHSQSLVRARTFDPGIGATLPLVIQAEIPRSLNVNARMRESYFTFILSEYETHRLRKFFRSPPVPISRGLAQRMKRSNKMLGFMYLGAKVFEVLTEKPKDAASDCCKKWIANFDRQVMGRASSSPSLQESEDRLTGLLELAYLTFLVVDTVAGYAFLKRALPLFLQLVSSDPELWSEKGGQLTILLPRILSTSRYEIRRFVFYDMMCSLALGVRSLAEYDPGDPPVVSYPPLPMEIFHGIPIEWIHIIGHVHTHASDWSNLETQTLSWRPRISDIWGEESVEVVLRMAIQESWRHTTLIYIYMGMCGVNSSDRRVQASVRQIIRLIRVVHDSPMDVHLSIPCLIAGIAARYETQRTLIYQKLLSFRNTHIWILRGADFIPVLRHLWNGLIQNSYDAPISITTLSARLHTTKTIEKLLGFLPDGDRVKTQIILLSGSTTPFRNDTDREMPLRQESNFFYLTGCDVANSHLMITVSPPTVASNGPEVKSTLFIPREDPLETMWSPPPPTLEAARSTHEVDVIAYSDEFDKHVAGAIKAGETAVHILPQTIQFPTLPAPLLVALSASGANPPPMIKYLLPALHSARLIKTEYEIELIRQANAISSRAHEVIMRVLGKDVKEVGGRVSTGSKEVTAVMPGQWRIEKEAEAEAIFVASCRREGAVHQAYMPIVASAQHAATLHYCCNDRAFAWGPVNSERQDLATQPANGHAHAHNGTQNGHGNEPTLAPQVLLLDAGCEWRNYASDITRTTPVGNGGKFTPEARAIYELVLKMQEEAIDSLKPGLHWDKVQLQCHLTLIDGFLELGLFKGERADIINSEISSAFFPHGVGHSLGLDVHDVPSASKPEAVTASSSLLALGPNITIPIESADHPSFYRYLRLRLPLATGMVLTVEPGIYFSPHLLAPVRSSPYIDHELLAKYESVGGVRIEDVLWITETGCQNFTMTGKSVEWIEKLTSGQA
ncbi:unnamed protein product [Rhizoctonia solani]|uniref:Aminopeptidase P N-terminal domain-containing protein n=1 Tax=Rhizoctonia solani TaxID=456999 RepID=A0A8H3C1Y3_9AGAM|nr:unnamed protein product [Rhizoctonia solani]